MHTLFAFVIALLISLTGKQQHQQPGYILERESEIGVEQPGPHEGGGTTTGYSFFASVPDVKFVFRKRVLHPGSAIGYHLQEQDEVYYIVSGAGELTMNGKAFTVKAGDAILTRPDSSHGLKPIGKGDLTLFIAYQQD